MSDIFDDIAKAFKAGHDAGRSEAADEIERLREALSAMADVFKATEASAQWALSEVERLREALRDIACDCEHDCADSPLGLSPVTPNCCRNFARTALGDGSK